jgi:hypothetical protein
VSGAIGSIVDQHVAREVRTRGNAVSSDTAAAQSTGRELELAIQDLERRGPAATTEADLLRVLNIVGAGLDSPRTFGSVAEARAYLSQRAGR